MVTEHTHNDTVFMLYNALSSINIDRWCTLLRVNLSFMIPAAIEMMII